MSPIKLQSDKLVYLDEADQRNLHRDGGRKQRNPDSNMEICQNAAFISAASNESFGPSRLIVNNNRQTFAIHLHSGRR